MLLVLSLNSSVSELLSEEWPGLASLPRTIFWHSASMSRVSAVGMSDDGTCFGTFDTEKKNTFEVGGVSK